jgi:Flp pilus assembly protein TadD
MTGKHRHRDAPVTDQELDLLGDLAYRLVRAGRFEEARRVTEGIVALDPDGYYGHALLGALWERCGDRREARRAYEAAVRCNPRDAASILNLGRMRILAGEVNEGLSEVRRAWLLEARKGTEVARLARAVLDSHGG